MTEQGQPTRQTARPDTQWPKLLLAVTILLLFLAGLVYLVYRLSIWLFSLETEMAQAIVAATGIVSAGILANVVSNYLAARARRDQDVRERKREVYVKLLETVFRTFKMTDIEDAAKQAEHLKQIVSEMRDITPQFLLWSSPPVMEAWRNWQRTARGWDSGAVEEQAGSMLAQLSDLINQMRLELGLPKVSQQESLGVFVTDIDEYLAP